MTKPKQPAELTSSLNLLDQVDGSRQDELAVILRSLDKLGMQMDRCLEAIDRVKDPHKEFWHSDTAGDEVLRAKNVKNSESSLAGSRPNLSDKLKSKLEQIPAGRAAVRPHLDLQRALTGIKRMNTAEVWNNDGIDSAWVHTHRFGWLLDFLDAPTSSLAALIFFKFRVLVVVFSLWILVLQCTTTPLIDTMVAAVLESSIDVVFLVELILQVIAIPIKLDLLRDPCYWPDVLVPFGLVIRISCGFDLAVAGVDNAAIPEHDASRTLLLCLLPVLRMLKLLRHFETYHLLVNAFKRSFEALPVLLYTLGIVVLSASGIVYWIEPRDNIVSLPHSMWFCIVTISTVGYGDVSPITNFGQLFVAMLVMLGLLFTAMPIGIVGHEFMTSWASRHRVMLISRTRKCLSKWGYNASDFEGLFRAMDADQDGKLDLPEFVKLVGKLNIGLTHETAVELFLLFDEDASGTIDFDEFLKQIYPFEYFSELHKKRQEKCHSCGNFLLPDAMFCRRCGESRKGKCSSCNSILQDDAEYCRMCGASAICAIDSAPDQLRTTSAPDSQRGSTVSSESLQ